MRAQSIPTTALESGETNRHSAGSDCARAAGAASSGIMNVATSVARARDIRALSAENLAPYRTGKARNVIVGMPSFARNPGP